jgi:hypothetical protein
MDSVGLGVRVGTSLRLVVARRWNSRSLARCSSGVRIFLTRLSISTSLNIRDFVARFPRSRDDVLWRGTLGTSSSPNIRLDMNAERSFQLRDRRRCAFFPISGGCQFVIIDGV